jgi:hypothetical protein
MPDDYRRLVLPASPSDDCDGPQDGQSERDEWLNQED